MAKLFADYILPPPSDPLLSLAPFHPALFATILGDLGGNPNGGVRHYLSDVLRQVDADRLVALLKLGGDNPYADAQALFQKTRSVLFPVQQLLEQQIASLWGENWLSWASHHFAATAAIRLIGWLGAQSAVGRVGDRVKRGARQFGRSSSVCRRGPTMRR